LKSKTRKDPLILVFNIVLKTLTLPTGPQKEIKYTKIG
jgi:hypothetical protein